MGFENNNPTFGLKAAGVFSSVTRWVNGLLGHHDFSPEETLAEAKNIDPRLVPKVPMQSTDIDANLMLELSKMGMKRGRLVSAESHPELMQAWQVMSARAGLKKAPQLIVVESKIINAMTVSPEEVVVTTALLKKLDLRETCAVLGHELGHATSDHKRPRIAAMAVFGIVGALVGHKVWQKIGGTKLGASSPLMAAVDEVMFAAAGATVGGVAANQISVKPTELQADLKGAAISGDPQGLISALNKLEAGRPRSMISTFLAHLHSGYPTTQQRIENLNRVTTHLPPVALGAPVVVAPAVPVLSVQPSPKVNQIAADARVEMDAPAQIALS